MNQKRISPALTILIVAFILGLIFVPSKSSAHVLGYNLSTFGGPGIEFDEHNLIIPIYGLSGSYAFKNSYEIGLEIAARGPILTTGIELNYFFNQGLFLGIQTGLDFDKILTFYIGPQIGFDYMIHPQWSIGPELQYLYTIHDQGGIFEALFNVKFFFSPESNSNRQTDEQRNSMTR